MKSIHEVHEETNLEISQKLFVPFVFFEYSILHTEV